MHVSGDAELLSKRQRSGSRTFDDEFIDMSSLCQANDRESASEIHGSQSARKLCDSYRGGNDIEAFSRYIDPDFPSSGASSNIGDSKKVDGIAQLVVTLLVGCSLYAFNVHYILVHTNGGISNFEMCNARLRCSNMEKDVERREDVSAIDASEQDRENVECHSSDSDCGPPPLRHVDTVHEGLFSLL